MNARVTESAVDMYNYDTSHNPSIYDGMDEPTTVRQSGMIINPTAIDTITTTGTMGTVLDLSAITLIDSRPFILSDSDRADRKLRGALGMERFLSNAVKAHASIANRNTADLYAIMAKPCMAYASRQLMRKWSVFTYEDKNALEETVQDIACMLLESKPLRVTVKGQPATLQGLFDLSPMELYRALCGRAYRLAMHNYGIGHNRTPLLTRGTKSKPAQFFINVPLDAFRGATGSAESEYIADAKQTALLETVDNTMTVVQADRLMSTFTPSERSALRLYLSGVTTSNGALVRAKARLAKLAQSETITADEIHGLLCNLMQAVDTGTDSQLAVG